MTPNNDNQKTSPPLQDYETEITDKNNFFATIISKFKKRQNQKLLNSGEKIHTTNSSISSMMLIGKFRTQILKTIENVQSLFSITKKSSITNSLAPQIIGEDIEPLPDNLELQSNQPIIPKNIDSKTVRKSTAPEPIIILAETIPEQIPKENNIDDDLSFLQDEEIPHNNNSSNTLDNTPFPTVPTPQLNIESLNDKANAKNKYKNNDDLEL